MIYTDDPAHLLFLLWFGHALADQPFQTELINRAKRGLVNGIPASLGMNLHCIMHGGFVLLFTDSLLCGCLEYASHYIIDSFKCRNKFGAQTDQALHLACKVCWVVVVMWQRGEL